MGKPYAESITPKTCGFEIQTKFLFYRKGQKQFPQTDIGKLDKIQTSHAERGYRNIK